MDYFQLCLSLVEGCHPVIVGSGRGLIGWKWLYNYLKTRPRPVPTKSPIKSG